MNSVNGNPFNLKHTEKTVRISKGGHLLGVQKTQSMRVFASIMGKALVKPLRKTLSQKKNLNGVIDHNKGEKYQKRIP
jgi:hypothetical protein